MGRFLWHAGLWTAGVSLTAGGFLTYFAAQLGAKGLTMSLILVLPEIIGASGFGAGKCIRWTRSPKRVWQAGSWLSLAALAGLPLSAAIESQQVRWPLFLTAMCAMACGRGLASVAFWSWLGQSIPPSQQGRRGRPVPS